MTLDCAWGPSTVHITYWGWATETILGVCLCCVWGMLVTRQRSLGMMTPVEYLASTSITAQGTTLYTYTSLKTPLLGQLQQYHWSFLLLTNMDILWLICGFQNVSQYSKQNDTMSIYLNIKIACLRGCKNQTYVLCIMLFQNLNIQIFCWYKYWSSSTHPICIDHRCPDGWVVTSKHGEKIKI